MMRTDKDCGKCSF